MTNNREIKKFTNKIIVDGQRVIVRPICREDAALEKAFVERLSPESRYLRVLGGAQHLSDEAARVLCEIDFDKKMAFVALTNDLNGTQKGIGVSRYATDSAGECEVAVTVADEWQNNGLSHYLMDILIGFARDKGKKRLYSLDLKSNGPMRELADDLGMNQTRDPNDTSLVRYELMLAE